MGWPTRLTSMPSCSGEQLGEVGVDDVGIRRPEEFDVPVPERAVQTTRRRPTAVLAVDEPGRPVALEGGP
ncbi:MAG: hypothetical protein H0U52_14635 [Chloroflexi bacterium]|nr:hypothetical protein [Chloroflexota bacterium]